MVVDIQALTHALLRGNPNVLGVLVVDGDGTIRASQSCSADVVKRASAMAVPLRELLDTTSRELACGELATAIIEGHAGSVAMADVDGTRSVIVIGAPGSNASSLRADSIWVAERVRYARWAA